MDNKTHKPYHAPEYLLKIYRWMQKYEEDHRFKPSVIEIVYAGFAGSTSVARYYLDQMQRLNMIEQPTLKLKGKTVSPARSIILIPLEQSSDSIKNIILKEQTHD